MHNDYTYQGALGVSERINWRIEDIIGGDKRLDFTKPFMPESLARVQRLGFLNGDEQRTLNQIRGHEYLAMFGLVEEFILPYVVANRRAVNFRVTTTGFARCSSSRAKKPSTFTCSNTFAVISRWDLAALVISSAVEQISPAGRKQIEALAPAFC
jgi:hypothetical protein